MIKLARGKKTHTCNYCEHRWLLVSATAKARIAFYATPGDLSATWYNKHLIPTEAIILSD